MFYVEIALLGIIFGCLYALSATGIVLTYTATGVFNIAHFAIALLAGYLGWQLSGVWGLPLVLVVPIVLVVCGPAAGPRARAGRVPAAAGAHERRAPRSSWPRSASPSCSSRSSTSSGARGAGHAPTSRCRGCSRVQPVRGRLAAVRHRAGRAARAPCWSSPALLYLLFQRTFLGTSIRAVVDRRELAELAAIDANRVSQVAWSLGCTLAALTGLIIPQGTLEPTRIIFFGIETFSVAVVARLTSVPDGDPVRVPRDGPRPQPARQLRAVRRRPAAAAETYQAVVSNLSSIVLFVALVALPPARRGRRHGGSTGQGLVVGALGPPGARRRARSVAVVAGGRGALVAPCVLGGPDLRLAQTVLALTVIFVSIVCITGFSGHLTLGQASIAGLGAFFTARAANALGSTSPVLAAPMLVRGVGASRRCWPGCWPATRPCGARACSSASPRSASR